MEILFPPFTLVHTNLSGCEYAYYMTFDACTYHGSSDIYYKLDLVHRNNSKLEPDSIVHDYKEKFLRDTVIRKIVEPSILSLEIQRSGIQDPYSLNNLEDWRKLFRLVYLIQLTDRLDTFKDNNFLLLVALASGGFLFKNSRATQAILLGFEIQRKFIQIFKESDIDSWRVIEKVVAKKELEYPQLAKITLPKRYNYDSDVRV